ncbi:hypothetical protein Bbelb_360670 [Branchiostoma belcheri]|nr:hypothetical protein Bbelb_360670 [Branchiostoma belcheri]
MLAYSQPERTLPDGEDSAGRYIGGLVASAVAATLSSQRGNSAGAGKIVGEKKTRTPITPIEWQRRQKGSHSILDKNNKERCALEERPAHTRADQTDIHDPKLGYTTQTLPIVPAEGGSKEAIASPTRADHSPARKTGVNQGICEEKREGDSLTSHYTTSTIQQGQLSRAGAIAPIAVVERIWSSGKKPGQETGDKELYGSWGKSRCICLAGRKGNGGESLRYALHSKSNREKVTPFPAFCRYEERNSAVKEEEAVR